MRGTRRATEDDSNASIHVVNAMWVGLVVVLLLLVGAGMVLHAMAMEWGPDIGDAPGQECQTRALPSGIPLESSYSSRRTWIPFGTECTFGEPGTRQFISSDSGENTAQVLLGFGSMGTGLLLAIGGTGWAATRLVQSTVQRRS